MNTTPETTARPFTLTDIAVSQNVIKRTAQNWLSKAKAEHGDIGELVNKVRYFSALERDLLISYAAPPRAVRVEPLSCPVQTEAFPEFTTDRPAEHRQVEVMTGNHRAMVDAPEMGMAIDLAQFRGDIEVKTYQDPLAAIEAANALIDAAENAMVADLNERVRLLQQTQKATAQLAERAENLKTQEIEYRVKQDLLGLMQNQETARLGELLGKAESLAAGGGQ